MESQVNELVKNLFDQNKNISVYDVVRALELYCLRHESIDPVVSAKYRLFAHLFNAMLKTIDSINDLLLT